MKDPLKDFYRLLEKQNFESKEDLENFLKSSILKPIPEFKVDDLTDVQKADNLVELAFDLPFKMASEKIQEALSLNPDCINAYLFLGDNSFDTDDQIKNYLKGIEIGRRIFGGAVYEREKRTLLGLS